MKMLRGTEKQATPPRGGIWKDHKGSRAVSPRVTQISIKARRTAGRGPFEKIEGTGTGIPEGTGKGGRVRESRVSDKDVQGNVGTEVHQMIRDWALDACPALGTGIRWSSAEGAEAWW